MFLYAPSVRPIHFSLFSAEVAQRVAKHKLFFFSILSSRNLFIKWLSCCIFSLYLTKLMVLEGWTHKVRYFSFLSIIHYNIQTSFPVTQAKGWMCIYIHTKKNTPLESRKNFCWVILMIFYVFLLFNFMARDGKCGLAAIYFEGELLLFD
jgi:hypothetical protein